MMGWPGPSAALKKRKKVNTNDPKGTRGFIPTDFYPSREPTEETKKLTNLICSKIRLEFLQDLPWEDHPEPI
jgi:hypothetical protein